MVDKQYEKEYLEKKERLKKFYESVKNNKEVQEIYHKLLHSDEEEDEIEPE